MHILIIEDEQPAADRLKKLLSEVIPDGIIDGVLVSIQSTVKWVKENPLPDLILMDINLADGPSFEIFNQVEITTPVIFITAFDQYALEAFKVNSVDYILKPVKKEELERAVNKFKTLGSYNALQLQALIKQLNASNRDFQKRIVIRYGDTIKMVEIETIAYFYTEDKINYLITKDNLRYPVDHNMDELERILDPRQFFRINRQFIININAIQKMLAWSKSRVKVVLKPETTHDTIVSSERSPFFKDWLIGGSQV